MRHVSSCDCTPDAEAGRTMGLQCLPRHANDTRLNLVYMLGRSEAGGALDLSCAAQTYMQLQRQSAAAQACVA
eukprot:365108-Chlamydomonas_euryale.AAC.3